MKLFLLAIFIIVFRCDDANGYSQPNLRCKNACVNVVDFKNIELALKNAKCKGKVNLDGLKSATNTVRSLVCECKSGHYIPKTSKCVQLYNCDIIIPLLQNAIPQIINDICGKIAKNVCEAIQIYIDNIANLYQSCTGGALSFQGDFDNGKQTEYYADTCYNSTIVDLQKSLKRFDKKVPGAGKKIFDIVLKRMKQQIDVYYGAEFRNCFCELSGQTIDICDCDSYSKKIN